MGVALESREKRYSQKYLEGHVAMGRSTTMISRENGHPPNFRKDLHTHSTHSEVDSCNFWFARSEICVVKGKKMQKKRCAKQKKG